MIEGTSWCVKQVLTEDLFPMVSQRNPVVIEAFILNAIAGYINTYVNQ
jgi:hypothetical protein